MAQNYGKGELERVQEGVRKSIHLMIVISIAMTVFVFLCGSLFMRLFMDGSETEILTRAAVTYLLVYRIGFVGMTLASPACWFTSTLLCVVLQTDDAQRV